MASPQEPEATLQIAQIMTLRPLTVGADESVSEALARMDEANIRHLPVLENERVVGVLSDRDLLQATGWFPGDGKRLADFAAEDQEATQVGDIMHRDPVTAYPEDQLTSVSLDLLLRGIGSVPVVDEQRKLVGIVTDTDLINAFLRASRESKLGPEGDPSISDYAPDELVSTGPETTIAEARALCRQHRIRHLPIVEGARLVGLVSDRDLRWSQGRQVPEDEPVATLMSTVLRTVRADARCSDAARLMTEFKVSCLPVVAGSELQSIVTTTDLLEHCGHTLWQIESFDDSSERTPRHLA